MILKFKVDEIVKSGWVNFCILIYYQLRTDAQNEVLKKKVK